MIQRSLTIELASSLFPLTMLEITERDPIAWEKAREKGVGPTVTLADQYDNQ